MATNNSFDITKLQAEETAKARYVVLENSKSAVMTRARDCAKLTIPSILPDEGVNEEASFDTPYQGVGAKLVNNLASKLLLTLLPPNTNFFRLKPNRDMQGQIKQLDPTQQAEIDAQLAMIENEGIRVIEKEALRVPSFEAFKSLIVTGNALLYKTEKGMQSYRLDQYVIQRDYEGNVTEIIMKEQVSVDALPDNIFNQLELEAEQKSVTVYTRLIRKFNKWYEYQEVEDVLVEGSDATYTSETLPAIPLRWTSINGENYGRGLVEQYLGDFRSLEALYQLFIETSAVQARTIFGKRPGAIIDLDSLNEAKNGQTILGDLETDITVLRVDKGADLNVPLQAIQDLTQRLSAAFLAMSSVARQSERTTAYEIQTMAGELEESLGGLYSVLSLDYQQPIAKLILSNLKIDLGELEVVIVTGVDALGRNDDLNKLRQFNMIIKEVGAELVMPYMDISGYIKRIATALNMETTGLIKSQEQRQQEQQAQQQAQIGQMAGEGLIKAGQQAITKQA